MTQLLVSIRDTTEAELINDREIAIVDIKEPNRGSLGAASPETLEAISRIISPHQTLSFAAGELLEWLLPHGQALKPSPRHYYGNLWNRFNFIKLGLAGAIRSKHDWRTQLQLFFDEIPRDCKTKPVVVSYLDFEASQSPTPHDLIEFASSVDACSTILFDTFDKSKNSLANQSQPELTSLITEAKSQSLTTVLAGSITTDCLDDALTHQPDFIGVRGAVCGSHRTDSITPERVNEFVHVLQQANWNRASKKQNSS